MQDTELCKIESWEISLSGSILRYFFSALCYNLPKGVLAKIESIAYFEYGNFIKARDKEALLNREKKSYI